MILIIVFFTAVFSIPSWLGNISLPIFNQCLLLGWGLVLFVLKVWGWGYRCIWLDMVNIYRWGPSPIFDSWMASTFDLP